MSALARRWLLNGVRAVARRLGEAERSGVEAHADGTLAALKWRRREALSAGCVLDDVDDATIDGLDEGRRRSDFRERTVRDA